MLQDPNVSPVAIWRRPAKRGAYTPLVAFLHGRGADEHDLISLADRFPRAFAYVSLRGPVALADGGFTWFESRGAGRPIGKSLRASVEALRKWFDRDSSGANGSRTYLCGFSAGMMMAGALVLDDPQRFAGAILLSGALPLDSATHAETNRLAGLPIFYGRGAFDDVMPAELVTQTDVYLRQRSGAELTLREYEHAHAIGNREIDDIGMWLSERA